MKAGYGTPTFFNKENILISPRYQLHIASATRASSNGSSDGHSQKKAKKRRSPAIVSKNTNTTMIITHEVQVFQKRCLQEKKQCTIPIIIRS
jgi:hypothetical protein